MDINNKNHIQSSEYDDLTHPHNQSRENWIDWAKSFAIWCVVLGHDSTLNSTLADFILLFHMPLFYLCSGYLFKAEGSFLVLIKKNVKRLLVPFVIYNLLWALILIGLGFFEVLMHRDPQWGQRIGIHIHPFSDDFELFCAPSWFLLSLFWCKILGYFLLSKRRSYRGIACCIWILLIIIKETTLWVSPLSIDTALYGGIWFVFGILIRKAVYIPQRWYIALIGIALGILCYNKVGGCAYVMCEYKGVVGLLGTMSCLIAILWVCRAAAKYSFSLIITISNATLFVMCLHYTLLPITNLFIPTQSILAPMIIDMLIVLVLSMAQKWLKDRQFIQRSVIGYCL